MALVVFSVLLIIFGAQRGITVLAGTNSCNSPTCVRESTRLIQQIDWNVNPCEDFYEFACGKYLRSNKVDETFNPATLIEQTEKDILDLYNEPTKQNEHVLVKSAKKLFKACMNTQAIEEDGLKTIKEVFKAVGGGWPLVEGSNWDETKFDWIQATYKLRELGYPFAVFFDVQVNGDPRDKTNTLLEIRIPFKLDEALDVLSDRDNDIKNVLKAFGARLDGISQELQNMYQFSEEMKRQISEHRGLTAYPTYKVSAIQTQLQSINWLEFLNKITRPKISVIPDNYIIFVEEYSIRERLEILSRTPKRTQANYMFWKLIEHMAPYLTSELRNYVLSDEEKEEPRTKFCLKTAQEKFIPNPINILYAKKFLPMEKRNIIRQLVLNMRNEFLENFENVQWMATVDKKNVEDKANALSVIIGEPESYFNERIFDEFIIDMMTINKENFLNILAQANRNRLTYMYTKINKSRLERSSDSWYADPKWYTTIYSAKDNLLRVPTTQIQDKAFDQNKPYYLTYGSVGKRIGEQMSALLKLSSGYYDKDGNDIDGWSRPTVTNFRNGSECIIRTIDRYRQFTFDALLFELEANIVGTKLAYETYKAWVKIHGQELRLSSLSYTPNQLFWISTVVCNRDEFTTRPPRFPALDLRNFSRVSTYAAVRNNPDFGKDFSCKDDTAMNPPYRCPLL
ncbi:hypothetical protein ILUMI_21600 [Ignelater luminosus]|uniref:Uncharacterized protein n=1 Tax=Ignelater luminosus TaxID=2038154 RepID=A0A8K0CG35_IGNLU|nr:hypothetical protein ILUMI_21600 [Ignelater luminosus]